MYKIIKIDGTEIGYTSTLYFIKISNNGCFVEANKKDAIGIAYDSIAYNLFGNEEIKEAETVMVVEVDEGRMVGQHEGRILLTEQASVELDMSYSEQIAALEQALCDLDKEITA